jgi:hypothetical protein
LDWIDRTRRRICGCRKHVRRRNDIEPVVEVDEPAMRTLPEATPNPRDGVAIRAEPGRSRAHNVRPPFEPTCSKSFQPFLLAA